MSQQNRTSQRAGIQVIARAAEILRLLKNNQDGLRLSEIAPQVDLPRSTVQRIVAALLQEHFVIADASGRKFRLGPEIGALAAATQYNVVEQCREILAELSQKTGETSDLSVLRGNKMIFLDQVAGSHRLRTVSSIGEAFPLTTTANGKACLAKLSKEDAKTLIQAEWKRQNIVSDLPAIMSELLEIKRNGLAYDLGKHSKDVSAIGFAFTDLTGDILSISVPVPSSRFSNIKNAMEKAIKEAALQVAAMMDRSKFDG